MGGCLWRVLGRDCDPGFKGDGEVNLPHGHRELKAPASVFLESRMEGKVERPPSSGQATGQ